MTPAEILTAHGLVNASAIVAAASRTGTDLSHAAALAQLESGGRNVFGNDAGGPFASTPRTDVTPERVAYVRGYTDAGGTSNGIGPAQITWPPLFARADRESLDLADPEDNMTLGLEVLREHLATAGGDLAAAGTLYNAGTLKNGVTDYGRKLAAAADEWQTRLTDRPATPPKENPTMTAKQRAAELEAYAATVLGRSIDVDGFPAHQPYQCVDLAKHAVKALHGVPYASRGNGIDVAANLARLPGWTWIPATGRGQSGDIVSWGAPYGVKKNADGTESVYGHVAMLMADDDGGRLDVLQADGFTAGAKVYRAKNGRTGLRGFARPPRYAAVPREYVVSTSGLNRRTTPGNLDGSALAYPDAPLSRGARWHGTGRTQTDAYGGAWIEGRSDWELQAGKGPTWVHGAYLTEVSA